MLHPPEGGEPRFRMASETEQMHGLPEDYTVNLRTEQPRNHGLGNMFHVPMLKAIIAMIIWLVSPELVATNAITLKQYATELDPRFLQSPSGHRNPFRVARAVAAGKQQIGVTTAPILPQHIWASGSDREVATRETPRGAASTAAQAVSGGNTEAGRDG